MNALETDCCVVGGGPAGMMLGYLLARAGVRVTVLEKHRDFLRDFRGDTIHPSTLRVMERVGLLDALLKIQHGELRKIDAEWDRTLIPMADFAHVPTTCKFIALMPQWDFLDLLANAGRALPTFDLRMQHEAIDLLGDSGEPRRVTGVKARGPDGEVAIDTRLVVACDGRHSRMRAASGLEVDALSAPMDVLWFALPHEASDGTPPLGRFTRGAIFILIDRGPHWQCGYVIPKGSIDALRARGFDAFKDVAADAMPTAVVDARRRIDVLRDWNDVSLLSVTVDRLREWTLDGLLCIGDAAHAMSPIGGVGINLAIQDAVATANLLAKIVRQRRPTLAELQRVQKRRLWPARATQAAQVTVQERVVSRALGGSTTFDPPLPMRVISRSHWLRYQVARLIGMGVRPEVPDLDGWRG